MSDRSFVIPAILAIVPSALLFWQGIADRKVSAAQIAAGAPEDILGFGPWTILAPVALIAAVLLVWVWRQASLGRQRVIAALEIALFAAAAIFATWSYALLTARVLR